MKYLPVDSPLLMKSGKYHVSALLAAVKGPLHRRTTRLLLLATMRVCRTRITSALPNLLRRFIIVLDNGHSIPVTSSLLISHLPLPLQRLVRPWYPMRILWHNLPTCSSNNLRAVSCRSIPTSAKLSCGILSMPVGTVQRHRAADRPVGRSCLYKCNLVDVYSVSAYVSMHCLGRVYYYTIFGTAIVSIQIKLLTGITQVSLSAILRSCPRDWHLLFYPNSRQCTMVS